MDKCVTCRYNTNDYVCHPNCNGCNGSSHYEGRKRDMTDINEIAKEIHKNAVAHGWWEETRTFPEIVALIHSELSEALEEYRSNHGVTEVYQEAEKPEGVPIELADAIIRILDYWRRWKLNIKRLYGCGMSNECQRNPSCSRCA